MDELRKMPKIETTNNVCKFLKKQLQDCHSICIVPQLSATPYVNKKGRNVKSKYYGY